MAKLIYTSITSFDGFIEDAEGRFDWSMPSEEVHAFVNELTRPFGTYLYGRRLYEVMTSWEDLDLADEPPVMSDFAEIWRAADKIVYSTSLRSVSSARTTIEPAFQPDRIQELKRISNADISIGGAELAGQALAAGLVDEVQQFLSPVIVGSGKRFLPAGVSADLELLEQRRFDNGVVYVRYRVLPSG
jgi:dihydrofolate reductase